MLCGSCFILKREEVVCSENLVSQVLVLVTLVGVSRAYCVSLWPLLSQGMASFGQSSVLKCEALSWHNVSL